MCRALLLLLACVCCSAFINNTKRCTHAHVPGIHKLDLDGRHFLLLVPHGLPTTKDVPVVVDVPGFTESPYYQAKLTGIMDYLEVYKWLAVIPFGTAPTKTSTCCPSSSSVEDCEAGKSLDRTNPCSFNAGGCCGVAPTRDTDDVAFARSMVDYAVTKMCADKNNVFATGFSNGGMMTNRLGCQAADLFRATAPVAGNIRLSASAGFPECAPSEPTAWISFCGTRDGACNSNFEETAAEWAKHNKCAAGDPKLTYHTSSTDCYEYSGCEARTEFCIIQDLGHEWPGHARPDGTSPPQKNTNIDASAFMFEKFAEIVNA